MESGEPISVKIIVIGESQVGKSKLIERFVITTLVHASPIDCDFVIFTQYVVRLRAAYQSLKLQIWDTAGQKHFGGPTYSFYKGSKGVVLVYDITCRLSFDRVTTWAGFFRSRAADAAAVLVGPYWT